MTVAALEAVARRAWEGRGAPDRALRAALVPAAVAYGAVTALRNRLYDAGWLTAVRVPAHVISVGNITVGGTGKTPAALWLAGALAARGRRVAIVARGYRKRRRGVVVVGEAGVPLVAPADGGDEAVLLARRFAGPVITAERRADAAALACARFAADTIVLDDGFQHRALARDADLVLLDESANGRLLPAGPLREPRTALARADALLVVDGPAVAAAAVPVFRARLVPTALVRAEGDTWLEEPLDALRDEPVVAIAGVARPERFTATLAAAGARVTRLLRFPDHHDYTPADVATIHAATTDGMLITTEKDFVKLAGNSALPDLRALRVTLVVDGPDRLLTTLGA